MNSIVRPSDSLQFSEQVHHLGLHGDVQCGDRLVAHHELGFHDERLGDADALTLAAGELVGVACLVSGVEPDAFEPLGHTFADLPAGEVGVEAQALGDDLAHGHARVQRRVGVLEDHLHGACVALGQDLALVDHFAGGLVVQPQDDLTKGGLAGAALADETDDLARRDVEARVVHGMHDLVAPDVEVAGEAAVLDEGVT